MKNTTVHKRVEALLLLLFPIVFLLIGLFQTFYSEESNFEFFLDDAPIGENELLDFRYRLEGHELNWKYNTSSEIVYESLPSGNYVFIVQSKIKGTWVEVFSTTKKVTARAFYLNPFFLIAIAIGLLIGVYLIFRTQSIPTVEELNTKVESEEADNCEDAFVLVSGKEQERINSSEIHYVSAHKNYIEIHQSEKSSVVRMKLGEFLEVVPDPAEYMQIRRSLIVRKDKVNKKLNKKAIVKGEELVVGSTYKEAWAEMDL